MGHLKSEWDIVAMAPSIPITANIPVSKFQQTQYPNIPILQIEVKRKKNYRLISQYPSFSDQYSSILVISKYPNVVYRGPLDQLMNYVGN